MARSSPVAKMASRRSRAAVLRKEDDFAWRRRRVDANELARQWRFVQCAPERAKSFGGHASVEARQERSRSRCPSTSLHWSRSRASPDGRRSRMAAVRDASPPLRSARGESCRGGRSPGNGPWRVDLLREELDLLVLDRPCALRAALAFAAAQELAVDRPQNRAVLGVDRDHRMQIQTAAAPRADHRRILNGQHVTPPATRPRARPRDLDHLAWRHCLAAQKPGQLDLSPPRAPQSANPHRATRRRHETPQQKGPPFSRRRSPNRPSDKSRIPFPSESTRENQSLAQDANGDA